MLLPSPGPPGKWLNWVVLMYGWRAGMRAGSPGDVCWIPAPGMPEAGAGLCSCWRCCRGWEELMDPPRAGCSLFSSSSTIAISHHRYIFFFWLFMSRVRRNSGRRMAQRLWGTRGWMWQRIEFWDLDSASCLNQQGNGEGSTKDPVPCLDTKCTWKSSHGVISTEEQTGQA